MTLCSAGCLSALRFEAVCGLRLSLGRTTTFHAYSMYKFLSVSGAEVSERAGLGLLGFGFPDLRKA